MKERWHQRNEAERAENRSGRWRRGGASKTRCSQRHLNVIRRHNSVKPVGWVKQSKGEPKRGSGGWRRLNTRERSYRSMPEWHKTELTSAKCGTEGRKQKVSVEVSQRQRNEVFATLFNTLWCQTRCGWPKQEPATSNDPRWALNEAGGGWR
jgi:hypothetical protein